MAGEKFYPKGEFIFREGESADYAYVLNSGSVEIIKIGIDGDVVLAVLENPNTLFGEMALIDGEPRSAGARAGDDSKITEVTQSDFLAYIQQNPTAAMNIMKNLSTEIRKANKAASLAGKTEEGVGAGTGIAIDDNQQPQDVDDTDAIYDTPPSRPLIYTGATLLLMFLMAFGFSYQAVVDTTVSARGKFTTKMPNVEVQSTSSAVVRRLLVKRGDVIEKGQLVVLLDSTAAKADLKGNTERLSAVMGRLKRLKLEQLLIKSGEKIPVGHGLGSLNLDILTKRLEQYRSKINSFASKIRKINKEISSAETEVSSAQETVNITQEQFRLKEQIEAARKKLYDSKHGSLLNYLQARDATLASRRSHFDSINAVDGKIAALTAKKADRGSLLADRNEFVAKWSSGLSENLAGEEEAMTQLKQQGLKLDQNVKNVEVRSPAKGTVLDVPTVSEGSIVKEGDRLVTLVLVNQPLTLEVDVDPKNISDVKLNIPVSVKLDALPFQQYGDLKGKLVYISEDTYTESLSGDKGAFYRGLVDIPTQQLASLPPKFSLTPGMLASADMKVGEKRIITYLANPILKGFSSAFSEPD
ncbi:MAG: HlyD family type I secretion periplasmic adaptor subunit [Rhodospirillaceae bacterium]|jgi:hemolysin D|nr:HlyD family type I secretion periplasmic adaptor subunit [Rhodospirillaceae bacterium]